MITVNLGKTVEIRTDQGGSDGIPHTYLNIDGKNYGFAPIETGLTGNGKIDIKDHEYNPDLTYTIQITDEQYNDLMNDIQVDIENPPFYNLPEGAQCTVWALEKLNDAGIVESGADIESEGSFLDGVKETLTYNPYTSIHKMLKDDSIRITDDSQYIDNHTTSPSLDIHNWVDIDSENFDYEEFFSDFGDGAYNTAVTAPYEFGDFLAKITGFRDWQEGSVVDDSYYQDETIAEMKDTYIVLKTVFSNDTLRDMTIDAIADDIADRPGYYLGNLITGTSISSVLSGYGKTAYIAGSSIGKASNIIDNVYADLEQKTGLSRDELSKFMDTSELKNKIDDAVIGLQKENLLSPDNLINIENNLSDDTSYNFPKVTKDDVGNILFVSDSENNLLLTNSDLPPRTQIEMFLKDNGLINKLSIDDVLAANNITDDSQIKGGLLLKTPQGIETIVNGDETIKIYTAHDGSVTYLVPENGNLVAYKLEYGNGGVLGENEHVISVLKTNYDGTRELTYETSDGTFKTISQNLETNTFKPLVTLNPDTNTATLNSGGSISEVASQTDYTSAELLEYNGISLEDARNLPVGFEVHIPNAVTVINGEYGNIKLFENPDGSTTAILPNQDNITYSSENDLLIYGDYTNPNKISFTNTSTGDFEVWEKDASGSMYQSQVSNEDFSINYTPSDDGKSKIVSKIEILSDNASFEDIAPHTDFSADDLREFNDYPEGTAITRDSIDIPKSKELLDGGNGFIVHLSGFNGNEMFIVPNQDGTSTKYTTFIDGNNNQALYETNSNGSTTVTLSNTDGSIRTIISNSDGYSFDSYGVSDVADISYTELPNGDLQVSGFVPKQDMTFTELAEKTGFSEDILKQMNGFGSDVNVITSGTNLTTPKDIQSVDSAYGDVKVYETFDGEYVVVSPNENGVQLTYSENLELNNKFYKYSKRKVA